MRLNRTTMLSSWGAIAQYLSSLSEGEVRRLRAGSRSRRADQWQRQAMLGPLVLWQ